MSTDVSNVEVTGAQRKLAKAFLNTKLDHDEVERVEANAYGKHAASQRAYRSCVRVTAMKLSRAKGVRKYSVMSGKEDGTKTKRSKNLPKCKSCRTNEHVTFKFDQRRSGDEGMTAVYTCEKCNVFWT